MLTLRTGGHLAQQLAQAAGNCPLQLSPASCNPNQTKPPVPGSMIGQVSLARPVSPLALSPDAGKDCPRDSSVQPPAADTDRGRTELRLGPPGFWLGLLGLPLWWARPYATVGYRLVHQDIQISKIVWYRVCKGQGRVAGVWRGPGMYSDWKSCKTVALRYVNCKTFPLRYELY